MRKRMLAIVLGVLVFSLVAASAASLGGLNVAEVGADSEVVASCDTNGIGVAFTTSHDGTEYTVSTVELSGVAAECDGQTVSVAVTDGTSVLGSGTATADASGSVSVALAGTPSAEAVTRVSVLISG